MLRAGRSLALTLCVAGLLAIVFANTASALNLYQDIFVTLSARPLAMGGCGAALDGPASVFYNPAGLASMRQLTLMHNHSGRHFPGSRAGRGTEWDQLDGDTQAVVVPLPIGTYAHGFSFRGEMGYDYRDHPQPGDIFDYPGEAITAELGYPRGHYDAREDYDSFGTSLGLPCAFGYSLRRSVGRFSPAADAVRPIPWLRLGQGEQWGLQARVWPGVTYGKSELKLNYDYNLLTTDALGPAVRADKKGNVEPMDRQPDSLTAMPEMHTQLKQRRQGWALRPCGWLTLASDDVGETYSFREGQGLGTVQDLNRARNTTHQGGELQLGNLARWRWGRYDGRPTVGAAFNLLGTWLNYSEVNNLLPEIVGAGEKYSDVHIYGAEIPLW